MSQKLSRLYPPYQGEEPFIYLCFAAEDQEAVRPLLMRLYKRGARVWYTTENSTTIAQEKSLQERMKKARLVIVYYSEAFLRGSCKGRMMFLQARDIPVISVDGDHVDNLAAGFREGTPHIPAGAGITDETEMELIRTEGFSQSLIGEKKKETLPLWQVGLLAGMIILTILAAVVFGLIYTGVIRPQAGDVEAADSVETTPVEEVFTLYLDQLPEDLSELQQYPNLQKIVLPQSEASRAEELIDHYTIVIIGEEE